MQTTDAGGTPVDRRVRPLVEHLREYADNVHLEHDGDLPNAQEAMRLAADEIERLRGIVAKGRAAYSAYGLLATPPNHDMHTEAGDKLRSEWLRETDDYLHGLAA